jgi:hypothetical protein
MKLRHLAGTIFIVLVLAMVIHLVIMPKASETFVDAGRCGVDLPSCSGERIRCMNGYCKSDIPPKLPPISDLPMTPPTKYPYTQLH